MAELPGGTTRLVAVVTGGGTAGHVFPALAVAEGLVARGHSKEDIHYVGTRRGVETVLVPPTGYPHTFYDVVGLQRRVDRTNLQFVPKLRRATRAARAQFQALRPDVVVSVGGYASLPSVLAARRLKIPVVVVSYDRDPGRASRLAARRAVACAVAFPDSALPRAVLTGAPVRQAILDVDRNAGRAAARAKLGVPEDRFFVAVMGGSLGSGVLNSAIAGYVESHADRRDLAVRHLCGTRFVEAMPPARDGGSGILYSVTGFEEDMAAVYAAADLLIGRGGASTVAEVAVTGIPAILVPWAGSAEDHQTRNVRWLSDQGAAILVSEAELDAARCAGEIDRLAGDRAALAALGFAAAAAGAVHRSGAIARLVEDVGLRRTEIR